ncbi:hypothetical protein PHYSODRAFT_307232 [Phytophthora sojae]|uniref:RxLR effector protein n=1 Tax=Phytophthora sojae (strain P6497) TaxID=1094619 RepID=G5ADF9_PHYSP|nr:hypothetical protein PHYSODRAFT_307232 [Phytophthora sojae]EGZ06212.1 hypothetical protein PHYSODRAFT_307232 [Phytophthora sojae]|eukprot:XP_009538109.1 hypothetical protein PHYSODRAFT_307232 [Phytophthora sojae]
MRLSQATALVALACLFVAGLGESVAAEYGNAAVTPGVGDELVESAPLLTISSPQIRSTSAKYSAPAKTPCPPTSPETIHQPITKNPGYGTKDPQEPDTSQRYPTTPDDQYHPDTEAADTKHNQTTKLPKKEDTRYQPKPNVPATGGRPKRGGEESGRFDDNGRDNQHHHRQPARTEDGHNYAKTDLPEKEDSRYQPKPNVPATGGRPKRGGEESGRFDDNGRDNQHHHRQPARSEDGHNYAKTDLPEKEDSRYQPKPNVPAIGGRPKRGGEESGRFDDNGRDNQHHHRQPARTEDGHNYAKTDLPEKEDSRYQPKPNVPATGGRPKRGGEESGRFDDNGRDNQHHHRQPARTEDGHNYAKTDLPEKEDSRYQPKPNVPAIGGRPKRGGEESGRFDDNGRDNQHHHRQPARTEDGHNYAKTDLPEKEDSRYQPKPNVPATGGRPKRGGEESGRFDDNGRDNQHHHRQPARTEDGHNYAKTDLPEKEDSRYQPKPNVPATGGRPKRGGEESGRFDDKGRDNQHYHHPSRTEVLDNEHYPKSKAPGEYGRLHRLDSGGDKKNAKPERAQVHDPKPDNKKKVDPPHHDQQKPTPKPHVRTADRSDVYSTPEPTEKPSLWGWLFQ